MHARRSGMMGQAMVVENCVGVNAVVTDERGRVLLARRDRPPVWNLPGGSWEPGESLWDTAVREVREEVGLEVEVVRLTGIYDRNPDGNPVLVFLCRWVSGEPRTSREATELGWFSPDALPSDIHPYQPQRIRDALDNNPEAILVRQTGRSLRQIYDD
jgi:8-oxo-dGTP pyrophosphatase MutT (NUDIX family)